ncbi:hypothetical protein [Streptomyces sp. NPDC094437]
MTADHVAEVVLRLVVSGVPLGLLVCPPHCTTCTTLNEGDR